VHTEQVTIAQVPVTCAILNRCLSLVQKLRISRGFCSWLSYILVNVKNKTAYRNRLRASIKAYFWRNENHGKQFIKIT
jgi:hypothetical protein